MGSLNLASVGRATTADLISQSPDMKVLVLIAALCLYLVVMVMGQGQLPRISPPWRNGGLAVTAVHPICTIESQIIKMVDSTIMFKSMILNLDLHSEHLSEPQSDQLNIIKGYL